MPPKQLHFVQKSTYFSLEFTEEFGPRVPVFLHMFRAFTQLRPTVHANSRLATNCKHQNVEYQPTD
jgi:hypothetical protein